jgi:protocatechuate 3,4-dioxygenase beta subunit
MRLVMTLTAGLLSICLAASAQDVAPRGRFDGRVVDTQGRPVAGAVVSAYYESSHYGPVVYELRPLATVTTGTDGRFAFDPKERGTSSWDQLLVVARKEGMALDWTSFGLDGNNAPRKVTLGRSTRVAGAVVDEAGQPIAAAEVRGMICRRVDMRGWQDLCCAPAGDFLLTHTDAQGRFSLDGVPEKATIGFIVTASGKARYTSPRTDADLPFAGGQADIKVVLLPESRIEGTVLNKETQQPVGGVALLVLPKRPVWPNGLRSLSFAAGPDGSFAVVGLPADEYMVRAKPAGNADKDWLANPIAVKTEVDRVANATVELIKGGVLEVAVLDDEGNTPITDAPVRVNPPTPGDYADTMSARTGPDGTARFRLLPGAYQPHLDRMRGYRENERREATVAVEDGKTTRIEILLTRLPRVVGVVLDDAGRPVAGAQAEVIPGGTGHVFTDERGRFSVSWYGDAGDRSWLLVRHIGRNISAKYGDMGNDQAAEVRMHPGVEVTGRILGPGNTPLQFVEVSPMIKMERLATRWSGSYPLGESEITDADGRYRFTGLPPGPTYDLAIRAAGFGYQEAPVALDDPKQTRIQLADVILELADLSVSGTVVDVEGKPVKGVSVSAGGGDPFARYRGELTDDEGKFTLTGLCKGEVKLSAMMEMTGTNSTTAAQAGDKDVTIIVAKQFTPGTPYARLTGRPLPKLDTVGLAIDDAPEGKAMVVCFFDMDQRPSRRAVTLLTGKSEELKRRNVAVVLVQAVPVSEDALKAFAGRNKLPFPLGAIKDRPDERRAPWGARTLPWLILTDAAHMVKAEGFPVEELDARLEANR